MIRRRVGSLACFSRIAARWYCLASAAAFLGGAAFAGLRAGASVAFGAAAFFALVLGVVTVDMVGFSIRSAMWVVQRLTYLILHDVRLSRD